MKCPDQFFLNFRTRYEKYVGRYLTSNSLTYVSSDPDLGQSDDDLDQPEDRGPDIDIKGKSE